MKFPALLAFALSGALSWACGGTTPAIVGTDDGGTSDGAAGTDSGIVDGVDFNTPTTCTSGATWTRGDRGSSSMHPGAACIACHKTSGGPAMTIAGTVFPSGHEPNDCNGINAGASVVVTDSKGKVVTLPVNAVGNFYVNSLITPPYNAKVVKGGVERAMVASQTTGDCNSCHTVDGATNAPGRIVSP
jgi:cytochrome c553